jgi:hypothetical protein
MNQAQGEMKEVVEDWLESYKGHKRYLAATENLYEVFARSWQGSRRYLAEAFMDFREALLRDSGHKHLEVTEVFPTRRDKPRSIPMDKIRIGWDGKYNCIELMEYD